MPKEQHPIDFQTSARACSLRHGWLFGPIVWRYRNEHGHYIYTVQDEATSRTVDVADFQLEILSAE